MKMKMKMKMKKKKKKKEEKENNDKRISSKDPIANETESTSALPLSNTNPLSDALKSLAQRFHPKELREQLQRIAGSVSIGAIDVNEAQLPIAGLVPHPRFLQTSRQPRLGIGHQRLHNVVNKKLGSARAKSSPQLLDHVQAAASFTSMGISDPHFDLAAVARHNPQQLGVAVILEADGLNHVIEAPSQSRVLLGHHRSIFIIGPSY